MTILLALLVSIPHSNAFAQAPEAGYVVKVDAQTVYLDLATPSGAQPGQAFTIFTEGEELKHPVTGASLGRLQNKIAEGTLKEVLAMYSVGTVSSPAEVKPGMRARLEAKSVSVSPAAAAPTATTAAAPTGAKEGRQPVWRSPSVDFQATGIAVADFKGDRTLLVALSDQKKVQLFPYPFSDRKPLAEFSHPNTNVKILNLEAADLNGDGKAELFVALYNETFTRFETIILQYDGTQLKKEGEIPGLVRAYQDPDGKKVLAVQQLTDDLTFPFNGIYPLVFKDGKYASGSPAIRNKRIDFLFDFTTADLEGRAVVSLTNLDHLRIQFDNGHYWKTSDSYGQTPIRVRWPAQSAGKLIEFHPPMPVTYDANKKAAVYLAHNISMLGSLSEPFGLFTKAEIFRKSWNGLALEDDWKADIAGYCAGMTVVEPPGKGRELAVAVAGTAGKTSIWTYEP